MSEKNEKKPDLLIPILIVVAVILLVAGGSYFAFREQTETIQGQADVTEYRISTKVPSRVLEIRVKEGDYVHKGDTLVLLDAPEVDAKLQQARAAEAAAAAQDRKALRGARQEQIQGAYEMWQKAKVGVDIAEKTSEMSTETADSIDKVNETKQVVSGLTDIIGKFRL